MIVSCSTSVGWVLGLGTLSSLGAVPGLVDWVVFVPLLTALVVGAMPRSEPGLARALGVGGALVELVLISALVLAYDGAGPSVQHISTTAWLPSLGVSWTLGVDGAALPMLVLLGLVVPLALMLGGAPRPGEPPVVVGMMGLQAAWAGVILARDLVSFSACWELSVVAMVVLIGERGDGKQGRAGRTAAARRYAIFALPGAAALIAATVLLGVAHAHASGVWSWRFEDLSQVALPGSVQYLGFGLVGLAALVSLPLAPLHGWLSGVARSGPTPVVAAILGIGMPMGVFLLQRVALPLFPLAAGEWGDPLAAVAVAGAIFAALASWAERDAGRALAHIATLHIALAVVGVLSGSAAAWIGVGPFLLAHGLGLTVLTAVFHGLRRDRLTDLGELAGWAQVAPWGLALAFTAALVLGGVPGSAGFLGSTAIVIGALREGSVALLRPAVWTLLSVGALTLGTVGLLRSLWRAARGSPRPGLDGRLHEPPRRERVVAAVAVLACLALGVAPTWLLSRTRAAQERAAADLQLARCLAIEVRAEARPRLRADFQSVCLDPEARIRQFYGLGDPP